MKGQVFLTTFSKSSLCDYSVTDPQFTCLRLTFPLPSPLTLSFLCLLPSFSGAEKLERRPTALANPLLMELMTFDMLSFELLFDDELDITEERPADSIVSTEWSETSISFFFPATFLSGGRNCKKHKERSDKS